MTDQIERLKPDSEFAREMCEKIEAALREHVGPLFDAAAARGFLVHWEGIHPNAPGGRDHRPRDLHLIKVFR